MFCPNCGKQIPENGAFCMNCGQKVYSTTVEVPQTPPTAPVAQINTAVPTQPVVQPTVQPVPQPMYVPRPAPVVPPITLPARKRSSGWIVALVIVAIVAIAACVVIKLFYKTDEQKIEERINTFEDACNDMDLEELFGCFDKKTRQLYKTTIGLTEGLVGGLIGFDLPIGDLLELGGMEMGGQFDMDIDILSITIDDDEAEVNITMNVDGEESESGTVYMCKEGSDWYIDFQATTGDSLLESFY